MQFFRVFFIISFLGSIGTLINCQFYSKTWNFGLKLFYFSSFSIFIFQTALLLNFLDLETNYMLCNFQGFLITVSELSTVLMTAILSYTFQESILKKNRSLFQMEQIFQIIGFGYPLILALM